jgi:hypothetical protein
MALCSMDGLLFEISTRSPPITVLLAGDVMGCSA